MFRRKVEVPEGEVAKVPSVPRAAVDIDLSVAATPVAMADRGWLESSRDLLRGVQVHEMPMDTLPNDLIAQFLAGKPVRRSR
jgi:hypothetical protein